MVQMFIFIFGANGANVYFSRDLFVCVSVLIAKTLIYLIDDAP